MNFAAITSAASERTARVSDLVEMTKPRLSVLVLFTVAAACFAATGTETNPWLVVHTVIGTALIAASASVMNQWLERDSDARMARTMDRPIPSGRVSTRESVVFAICCGVVGVVYLTVVSNWLAATLGILTWASYVMLYTPLKRKTPWNTVVGAVPGAMPILIGWAATGANWTIECAALFLLVFCWQFPHFMAIAWKYRKDYEQGGMKMLTVTEPTGIAAGVVAVIASLATLIVSLWPASWSFSSSYVVVATLLGLAQVNLAIHFLVVRDDLTSRRLLRATLLYLPLVLLAIALLP